MSCAVTARKYRPYTVPEALALHGADSVGAAFGNGMSQWNTIIVKGVGRQNGNLTGVISVLAYPPNLVYEVVNDGAALDIAVFLAIRELYLVQFKHLQASTTFARLTSVVPQPASILLLV